MFKKLILISSVGLAATLALTLPGNASVIYNLEFFDNNGERVGTGEFSHEDHPFNATVDLCFIEPLCGSIPFEINAADRFFRLEYLSSTIPSINILSSIIDSDQTALFWRPFDDELVAALSPCNASSCAGRIFFNNDSWSLTVSRGLFFEVEMTATTWNVDGGSVFLDASGTWTATRRTVIPEPALTLGLIVMGMLAKNGASKKIRSLEEGAIVQEKGIDDNR